MHWDGICFGSWRFCQENKSPLPSVASENAVSVTGIVHAVRTLAFPFSPSPPPPPPPPPQNTRRQVDTQNYQSRWMRRLISKRKRSLFGRLRLHVLAFLSSPTAGPLCHHAVNIYQWPSEAKQRSPTRFPSGGISQMLSACVGKG